MQICGSDSGSESQIEGLQAQRKVKAKPLAVQYCTCDSRGSGDSPLAQRLQDRDESIDVAEPSNLRTTQREIRVFPPVALSPPKLLSLFNLTAAPTVFMTDAACFFIAGLLYMSGSSVAGIVSGAWAQRSRRPPLPLTRHTYGGAFELAITRTAEWMAKANTHL